MVRAADDSQDLPDSRASLVALLRARAEGPSGGAGYSFLGNGETETSRLTYAELHHRARALGAWLQRTVAPGERVLLQFPPGLDFISAFFGCLYGGVVAVPAYPPSGRDLSRLRSLARDAAPRVVLTTSAIQARIEGLGAAADLPPMRWQAVDALEPGGEAEWRDPGAEAGTVAFLQYTSGSTGDPKGVVVSHGNLLANQEAIRAAFGQTAESVIVGWLPLYHDMGLIGTVLQPLYVGAPCVLMAPAAFLQKPVRWLEAISRHRATTSGAPNFAYDLCVHKITPEQREGLDLRSWSVAFNGAEPVRAETIERFARAFAPQGFRREAFQPCYGLAEATLLVSGSRGASAGPELRDFSARALAANRVEEPAADGGDAARLVGSGRIAAGQRLVVADPETRQECAPGAVGEIWVAGPCVAAGYFRRPEVTAEVFEARLAGGEGPFLRTGDLGFVQDGELFVTGRLKDLIILRGRNLYPHDVERAAERSHPALRPGCGAAFSIDAGGEERLVVVHEIERGRKEGADEIIAAIRRGVAEEQEAALHDVVLLGTGRLPKTTSGKVQRRACRAAYLSGDLAGVVATARRLEEPVAGPEAAAGRGELLRLEPAERRALLLNDLRGEVARLLRVPSGSVDADLPLPSLGFDSLAAVELAGGVAERLGVALDLSELLAGASLSGLTEAVLAALAAEPDVAAPALVAGGAAAEFPLSYSQRALWFLERLAPTGGAYHIAVAARVAAPLDPEALRRSLRLLIERHPALRTTFAEGPEGPLQRVWNEAEVDLRRLDAGPGAPLQGLLEEEAYRPFDLTAGPLLRVRLIASGAENVLLLTVHHLVADFWSLAVLARELGRLYAAETGGVPALLEPLPLRYADFVRWQEERLAGPEGERLWRFWSRALGGALPDLSLPMDRPRPPVQTYGGGSRGAWLPPELSDAVRRLARERGATLYGTLLASWLALLHRYSGQEDLIVGSPTAGRGAPALAGLAGYFVNPVAVRAAVSGTAPFGALLERVRDTVGEVLAHQAYPLALLAERLQPVRDPSRPPIFQVMFVHQRPPRGGAELGAFALHEPGFRLELGGLALEPLRMERRRVQFDLTLIAAEVRDAIGLALEHNAGLFDGATVERMLGHLRLLLEGAAADPGRPVDELPLLTAPELEQVRSAWNDTRVDYPEDALIHHLIEAQADRTPEALAVAAEEESLTYRELERRANQLARHLAAMGVGPDVRVGVCLERGADLVVGLLATLKAGGAYVPLEPTDPAERLAGYLEDAEVRVTLSHERHAGRLPAGGGPVVWLDRDRDVIARRGTARPLVRLAPDNLAYTLFTSGSTGRPKGAMNTHRGIANRLLWMQDAYGLTPEDRVLQKTPFTFDVSVWEFFWPLMTGARLVMARPGGHRDPAYLARIAAEAGVTTVHFVPSVLGAFLDEPGVEDCVALRRVICSGEALTPELVRRASARLPGAELHNLYGPTEAAVDVTAWPCPREGADALRTVPIGRPIANTQIHLLDRGFRPVPAGVPGELYIGGVQLARGYAGRPDLTAERFVPDPFGGRLYRTGDLARFLADGQIEYLGRADHQVKIRGVRIELGEIEAELARHPLVRGAAVVVREEGGKRLVAYVAAASEDRPAPEELRGHLRARLPEVMVPADWVILDALPLTSSGKVDRRALPAPDRASRAERTPPRTPTEELLAGVWSQLTGRGPIFAEDDFFALGGHSLLATRVLSRVRDLWGIELPVHALFESPTLAGFARRIDAAAGEGSLPSAAPALEPVPRDRELPLSYAQQRFWFLDRQEPGSAAYNVPGAVRLRGRLDPAALAASWSALARRHEALRTVFPDRDGRPWQRILPPGGQPLPLVDLGGLPPTHREQELERLTSAEARRPFDLEAGPLVRTLLVRRGAEEHVNLVTMHHVAADGWALGVAVRDLAALYAALSAGRVPILPELPVQVADFAVWQRRWLEGGALEAQAAYWRQRLTPAPELLQLPTDRPRPAQPGSRGGRWEVEIDAPLREALAALGRREGGTLFMTLLAGFQALLARITGQTDVAVGAPVANRNRSEIEGLIGCFVNTLVLRTDLGGGPAFRDLLARVRTTTLEAYAHQDLPFERLVDELRLDRGLGGTPLFRALLAFQDEAVGAVELPGLSVEPVEVDNGATKLDLALRLNDGLGGLAGSFQFAAELFDRPTVGRLAGHLRTLLAAAAADPGARLRDLPLLDAAERHQLVLEWSDTERSFPEACVHRLVEAQVARTPEALAVVLDGSAWTYRDLDARAGRLARRLRALGVGPGAVVGVCLERSLDMVAALLAVLKAGGAYLPLDPDYPEERLGFLVDDAGVRVLIARPEAIEFLRGRVEHVVEPGADSEESGPLPGGADLDPDLDEIAYVIYTSGSTGVPKGVMVSHRAICNRLLDAQRIYRLDAGDRLLQGSAFSFDFSVWEIFAPLLAGARLVLMRPGGHRDAAYLVDVCAEQKVTHAHFVPSLLQVFLEQEGVERCRSLKAVYSGGEALSAALHRRFFERLPGALYNQYGPTEAAVDVTWWESREGVAGQVVPIGRPFANVRLYVLDPGMRPVPAGVHGELHVAGVQLARGYLGRPDVTARQFVPDPFATDGGRLYRTGDLVRFLPDGNVDYLGRIDHQVKVRGFRIELGEIEAVLAQHPGVREAAAAAVEISAGDRRLAAWIVPESGQAPSSDELRAFLGERLPEFMVPGLFSTLAALPRTGSGKLDRGALPAPERARPSVDADYEAPRTPGERLLARLWSEVLGVERVGVHDNFFALGGDSILSIQVVSRANQAGLRLTPRQVFEHQTVAGLAAVAGAAHATVTDHGPVSGPVPLTPIQRELFAQELPDPHHYNQAVLLEVRRPLPAGLLRRALAVLLEHHDALRLRFAREDGGWRQWVAAPGEEPSLPEVDLSAAPSFDAALEEAADAVQAGFDLGTGPLLRGVLFRAGRLSPNSTDRLLLVAHHLVVDGVSWRILAADLEAVCARLTRGEAPGLPPRTTSYREWAEGLVARASDGTFAGEVEGWIAAGGATGLPLDEPAGPHIEVNTVASARTLSVALSREETEALLREVPAAYRTRVDETLLASLALGLRRWTGAGRLRLDVEGHGREDLWPGLDLSRTVGWFTSRFPLALDLPPGDEPGEALRAVKEQVRAVPRRGIGYGVLRHLGEPAVAHRLAEAPRPEVSFNYLGQLDPAVAPDALFGLAAGPTGAARGRRGLRKHLLEVDGGIAGGRLELTWTWSEALHRRATVEALAEGVLQALRGVIEHCRAAEAGGFTPSDFPLARLDRPSLDRIAGRDRRIEDVHPLSPTQEGILFHALLEPGTGAYFEQMACTLRGALDAGAFERAWHEVVDRHPALRAAFVWEGLDRPLQIVRRPVGIPWQHLEWSEDWSGWSAGEREARLAELYRQERERGFELTRPPLLRCLLVRLADDLHHFVWNHHHLLLDGWSLPLVLREVFTAYAAFCEDRAPALAPARPFRDYVAWLQEQDLAAAEAFWRRSLEGFAAPTRLEADAGPMNKTEGHGTAALRLEPASAAALRALARRHQLTLSTLVQGAWALLLHRHSGAGDVVFGATVSGRPAALPGVESIVGVFINSLPVRARAAEESLLLPWLEELQAWQVEQREHEHSPLVQVREWSPLARDLPLFETLLIFENYPVGIALDEAAGLRVEDLRFFEQTHYPLTVTVAPQEGLGLALAFDRARFGTAAAARLLRDYAALLEGIAARPQGRLADLPWMSAAERQQLLVEWNDTAIDAADGDCIHRRFEAQARRTPGEVALVFGRRQLTYAELDRQADALARRLRRLGVGPDVRVALCAERSLEMVAGLLAVLKAGGAYVPLDPAYPAERLALMLEDSGARVLLTQEGLLPRLPTPGAGVRVLLLDGPEEEASAPSPAPQALRAGPDHLAYVIYTSGSTGRPKGVMVPHRGVLNFFAGMDARLGTEPGVWLAVTSISFDISVLELLWTLCRGFRVVLQKDAASLVAAADSIDHPARELDLSLFYFAAEEEKAGEDSYRLLLEGARFADRHGLAAVWTPERHFHAFGGQYPNPAVTGAAVAAVTERIQIRAGSVVLPLHHPVRVAEDWAVIDRLSGGRVGLSFATGWHADDFVFAPESYPRRKEALLEGVDTVRRLWRGEAVTFPNGAGRPLDVRIHPRPVQPELPFWLTAAGNPETFRQAGALGANLLTHLLGQTPEDLAEKIALYRRARQENGHDPRTGRVTLMVHTFVGDDLDAVRETVKGPFCAYLQTSLSLIRNLVVSVGMDVDPEGLSPEDTAALLEHAFDRYFEAAGLFGTPETCRRTLERFQALGVDEVACLIDFGVETERVLAALPNLAELRERARRPDPEEAAPEEGAPEEGGAASLAAQVVRHGVTHLQCTPSLAGMLVLDGAAAAALASLRCLMVGGEAFPPALAERLAAATPAAIHNMYGPTETTIWSSTWAVPREAGAAGGVTIGRPIANTSLHLVDRHLRPVPLGLSGELLIGGLGVVRGYLDRPDLTAERFVPDPFGPPGARLYRTGDLARRRPDGEIEFLGRLDHQVKIRGIRIELGEIEALLARHPLVREAVVVAREGGVGEARLVAYLVPRRPLVPADFDEIDAFLRQSLPEAMIPSAWVPLEAFPLTPNRKVDRKALPDPAPMSRDTGPQTGAPRTPTEEVVAEIWGAVLGVERVGVHDGFFDLGGHSLLATQVVSRVRDTFRVDLPLRSLFETPTVEGLALAVDRMRQQEQGAQAPPLAAGGHEGELPLSFGQERIWFLNQLAPGSAYNDFTAFRLLGDLDAGALERSLGEIVRRHETLRTAFAAEAGRARPAVAEEPRLAMPVVDLRLLPAAERHAALERLARQEARALFDLGQAPLLRALLLRLGAQEHALCLTIHHIATDGWSWRVLFRELAVLYDAFAAGRPSPLPALPVRYVDFARWQRQWLQGEVLERQLAYWREALRGRLPVLELPTDRPRPAVQSFRGATRAFALPAGLGAALRGLGRGERATLFMTLLAVFEVLLHRLSGQDDLLVGTPVANRGHSELEALIGVFVNTLVLRTDASGEPTFRELLARVREVALGAYAHQDLPFEKLVDALQIERDLSHTPLFQVAFVLQNAPLEVLELESLAMRPLEIDPGSAKFDLTLALADRGASLQGWLEYNTDVFDAATMERLLGRFVLLAEGAVADPGRRIAEMPLLSAAERQALLAEWGGGSASFAGDATIADLFARQADANPSGVALACEGEEVTYAELEERANRLAWFLIERGVGPEVPVGLYLGRGIDLVVALLAVLKAGGAYVPLDPAYPAERLAFMLEDAGAPVLLTRGDLPAAFPGALSGPWGAGPEVVRLDERRDEIERHGAERPARRATAAGSAYVIFTSGSTGRPKGVMVSHGNVVRLLCATERWFGFGPADVWTLFHSSAFDFSVWELWGALAYGGRLVIVPFWVSRSPEAFYELLVRERVTVLNQTPSAFRQLIHAEALAGTPGELSLRLVIFGGEALELRSLEPWFARHAEDRPRLVNMYGITETTVHVTYRPITAEEARRGAGSVIGVPIPDLAVYVLDRWGNPAPPGVPGELCVGGAGLARGYLGRPELTAGRFVPDPFGGAPGGRLYRSGDLVRFVARGELEYLGRIDHQVKVRGFRIELGEIEAVLAGHPAVREAVVAPRAGRLVAWVVPAATNPVTPVREGDLQTHLRSRLPDYMVPAAFVFLESLPTTPSGKVDRRALPEPGAGRPDLDEGFAAPRNPVEETLAAIWREVLGRERVGVHDNYFRLGGDSILILQIVARARAAGLAVTPRQIFEHQTVAELAAVVGSPGWDGGDEPVSGPVPLTPVQRWFFEREVEEIDHFNLGVLLELREGWDAAALGQAVELLPRHHDALRHRFARRDASRRDGSWHQEVAPPDALPALVRVDLSALPEPARAAALRAASAAQRSLDLAAGPVFRAVCFDFGPGRAGRLLLAAHHLVIDGVSWRILLEDLETAYGQILAGGAPALPARTTSFKTWAERLQEHARAEAARELDAWLGIGLAAGRRPPGRLPVDLPGGENTVGSAAQVEAALGAEETRALLHEVPTTYRTRIQEALLAGLALAASRWTGARSLLIDLEGHGREEILPDVDLSRTVGWFTALFPMLLDLGPAGGAGEALKAVKEHYRQIPNHGLGYGLLRYLGEPEAAARLAAQPRAEVLFNFWGQLDRVLAEGSLLRQAAEPVEGLVSPRARRSHLLEVNCRIVEGRLRMVWTYSRSFHRAATVEAWAQSYADALRSILDHCRTAEAGGATPSDFPLVSMNQKQLDRLLRKHSRPR